MFCGKCGSKLDDNVNVCPNCGNKIINANVTEKVAKDNTVNKKKLKPSYLIIIAVIAAVIAIPAVYISLPSTKIIDHLNSGEYDEAVAVYQEYYTDKNKKDDKLLKDGILFFAEKCKENFYNEKIEYDDVGLIFDALADMGLVTVDSTSYIIDAKAGYEDLVLISEDINFLNIERERLEDIDTYSYQGDYEMALDCYFNISKNSELKQKADEKIASVKESYKTQLFNTLVNHAEQDNFYDAAAAVSAVAYRIPDNTGSIDGDTGRYEFYSELYSELKEKYRSLLDEKINQYLSENNYYMAEDAIDSAMDYFGDDAEIQALQAGLEDSYVKISLDAAKQEFDNGNYEMAASTVQAAMEQVEDNTELENKYNEYKAYLPAYLNDLDYFNIDGYIGNNSDYDKVADNTGKSYGRAYCVDGWNDNGNYAEYLINGSYTDFEGTVGVAYQERSTSNSQFFEVYGDGILLYTSPILTAGSMPQQFNINISGVKILKIYYPYTKANKRIATIFDGKLYNSAYTTLKDVNKDNNSQTTENTTT